MFCAVLAASSLAFFIPPKLTSSINDIAYWYTYSFSKKDRSGQKIVAVAIDEYSLEKIQQRWPWKRDLHAKLVEALAQEKPRVIGIDLAFVGESQDVQDDLALATAIKNSPSRVILACFLDYKNAVCVLPLAQIRDAAYGVGLVNMPADPDGKVRRISGSLKLETDKYYFFPVMLAAVFLDQPPEAIINRLPLGLNNTFIINYFLRSKDILQVSFYDVLNQMEVLKKRYGPDFLKEALVLVYPEAEIFHDTYLTPLGKMPGGLLNLNATFNIVSGSFIDEVPVVSYIILFVVLFLVYLVLRSQGFLAGLLITVGLHAVTLWILVLMMLKGFRFDYALVVIFSALYFAAGNIYKYVFFLAQLLRIKDKATLDPLRGLYTLRYFYYRLDLELKKIYFRKDLYLVFLHLDAFRDNIMAMNMEQEKKIWGLIRPALSFKGSFWSLYSQEELIGCLPIGAGNIEQVLVSLRDGLGWMLRDRGINSRVRMVYVRLKKDYPLRGLLFFLEAEVRKPSRAEAAFIKDDDLRGLLNSSLSRITQGGELLDSLDEDIEEKNRQLLSLTESLIKEHQRTEEAFFQIIASLVNALEARDSYTQGHSEHVSKNAVKLAEKLGWSKEEKDKLKKAGLLHDLGKIGIPDSILHKKDRLTDDEFSFIKKHSEMAVKILEPLKEFNDIVSWIQHHHEKWNGGGYPHGLAGNDIPQASQILSLADVWDALTTGRDYKRALTYEEAAAELAKNKGIQFNPELTDIFLELMRNAQGATK